VFDLEKEQANKVTKKKSHNGFKVTSEERKNNFLLQEKNKTYRLIWDSFSMANTIVICCCVDTNSWIDIKFEVGEC